MLIAPLRDQVFPESLRIDAGSGNLEVLLPVLVLSTFNPNTFGS